MATFLLAASLVAGLPAEAWAAAPVAEDDPSAACGAPGGLGQFGNSWPIPEDSAQQTYVPGMACAITSNDSDPDGDDLAYSIVTMPAHGDLQWDATGLTAYTPDPDYSTRPGSEAGGTWVSDSYVYQVSDGTQTDTATHRFFIAPINDPPTFEYDLGCCGVWAWEDSGPYSQPWASNISPGPGPSEAGQTVSFDVNHVVVEGDADLFAVDPAISPDGTLTFTPGTDKSGRASITVVAHDDGGLESYLGVSTPVANDQSEMVAFGISVFAVDDAPVAGDDPNGLCPDASETGGSFLIPEDGGPTPLNALQCELLLNDTDVDTAHSALTWEMLVGPAHGTVTKQGNYEMTYEPDPDYATRPGDVPGGTWVSDSFTYRAFDGNAYSQPATARYWIAEINDPPSFLPGTDVVVAEDSPAFSDPWASGISPGPPSESWQTVALEVTDVAVAGGGTLFALPPAIGTDGTLTFTAAPGASGVAQVTVQAKDSGGLDDHGITSLAQPPDDTSEPVTFQITISGENDAPVAADEPRTVSEDQTSVALSVLTNDSDPDGDPLTITAVAGATMGSATIVANDVRYLPNPNVSGTDSLLYTVADGHGGTDTATVTVTITPVNDTPVAVGEAASVVDGPAAAIPVLANDTDVDGDALQISSVTNGNKGTVVITGGGTGLTYDPKPLSSGSDTFMYAIDDGHGGTASAIVNVTITPDAQPPIVTSTTESLPGQTLGTSTVRTKLAWAAIDSGSGVGMYQLQVSVNSGAYSTIALPTPTTTSITRTLTIGSTYRFRVRARDRAGNLSQYASWRALTPTRLQEGTSQATYTGTWSLARHPSASNGRSRYASAASRKAIVRFYGRDVGWVATRTSSSGRADVRIDGVLVKTVQLDRASTAYRQLVLAQSFSSLAWHTIEIRPRGDGRVDVDAIVVLR